MPRNLDLGGTNNIDPKNPFGVTQSRDVSSNQIETPKRRSLPSASSSGTLSPPMLKRGEGIQAPLSPAMQLDQRLQNAGAYDRLEQFDPRRRRMLQTYLTTPKSALDVGKEVGLNSSSRATELLHSAMEVAFFALPEDQRAEYDNNPSIALQTRSRQQTETKSERLKEAHSQRPTNSETGKVEFSETHRQRLTEANLRRWEQYREAQSTGRRRLPINSRPSSDTLAPPMRKLGEEKQGIQPEDQPSE